MESATVAAAEARLPCGEGGTLYIKIFCNFWSMCCPLIKLLLSDTYT